MKKIFTLALCLAAVASAGAQKQAVNDAKKLAGKNDKIADARSLIKGAMQNPETANDAQTYYVAGLIEYDAYDNARTVQMINPDDKSIDTNEMGNQLINGYEYFLKALPLDSLPDAKGKVKPKYSKDIVSKVAGHTNDFFNAGANFYNAQKFYPEAYTAFMIYGDMPNQKWLGDKAPAIPEPDRAQAFYNAGICAYSGNQVALAADAFRKARLAGSEEPTSYIYEIACWQNIMANDSTKQAEAQKNIYEVAEAGNAKFGIAQPVFINNIINYLVFDGKPAEAMERVDKELAAAPENAGLYGLRAFINAHNGDFAAAEADYRKAASIADADFETLKNASKMIFRMGTQKWNEIEGTSPEAQAKRQDVKNNYWGWALQVAEKAATMNPNDSELNDILDSIEYNMSLN